MPIAHGANIGHGFVKYAIIDQAGERVVTLPSMIAPARLSVAGSLSPIQSVEAAGERWWVGDDAMNDPSPITMLSTDRLSSPHFIPALVRGALSQFGDAASGVCVTGLPASWSDNKDLGRALGARLRESWHYPRIHVIPEPLGLIYAVLLDTNGEQAGDDLFKGRVAVVDLGHLTVDTAEIDRLRPQPSSLNTFSNLGTSQVLGQVRNTLSVAYEREVSILQADQAIRDGGIRIAGKLESIPPAVDHALRQHGQRIAARLVELWGRGRQFDAILLGGGGAELDAVVLAIQERFSHAAVIADPQTAIARGYARLAMHYARTMR